MSEAIDMKDAVDRLVYERGLAFYGRMSAGESHEIKNVLGIINELGGLIEDVLLAARSGGAIAPEQLARIAESIARQVRRGDSRAKSLHHFSHNVDAFGSKAPLQSVVEEIVDLCQRIARLKKAQLVAEFSEDLAVEVDRVFVWQHVVYECICLLLEVVQPDDVVTVRPVKCESRVSIEVAGPRALCADTVDSRMAVLEALTAELGSTIELVGEGSEKRAFSIAVPA